jgi:hypothetical protein
MMYVSANEKAVSLNLHRYIGGGLPRVHGHGHVRLGRALRRGEGLYNLNPVNPERLKAPGDPWFQPSSL